MKVIIADDHPVVRQGLRQMLAVEQDLQVVGEARNGQEVVDLSRRVPWEVAVLDYNMPGKNGLELIKELRQRYPGRAVLILSMYPEDRYAVRALKAGASGYLTKESAPAPLSFNPRARHTTLKPNPDPMTTACAGRSVRTRP